MHDRQRLQRTPLATQISHVADSALKPNVAYLNNCTACPWGNPCLLLYPSRPLRCSTRCRLNPTCNSAAARSSPASISQPSSAYSLSTPPCAIHRLRLSPPHPHCRAEAVNPH